MHHSAITRPALRALFTGLLLATSISALPQQSTREYTIEQFMATTKFQGASFSPNEDRVLYSSNETGIFNAYTVPVGGGEATPVTRSTTDSTYAVAYFPSDDRILVTRDKGGDEQNHLFVIERDGKHRDLTPGEKLKARFVGWTHDGGAFHVLTNERDPKFFDVYRYDAQTYDRKLVYQDDAGYHFGNISDDGKWIAFGKTEGTANSDVYVWDVDKKEMKLVSAHSGQAQYDPETFDRASKTLYYTTNDGGEFTRVRSYDLASGEHDEVERADWDIQSTSFSYGGKYRVTVINVDGSTAIKVYDAATKAPVALPKLPEGDVTSIVISKSEKRLAFYVNGDRSPNNLFVASFGDKVPVRLTDAMNKEIDSKDLVEAEIVRFKSFDGMVIPNILYKPHRATRETKAPALVWVHGGPGGQTRRGYSPLIQYLANHGYVVLGINNRGSSGYGRTFFTADDKKHGHEPLLDCVAAKKYLVEQDWVDPERIGIIGGSYGGYMVLAALAFQPEAFDVGVDLFGVSNWVRTLESIPSYWEAQKKALYQELGDPKTDAENLRAISPVFHADKIKKPLMVLQGANDPRVIKPESDDIVAAAKKNGVPVEYVVFPDEGHGFTKRKNEIEGYSAILKFLDAHLKRTPAPVAGG
jgi:dipeptidyl aminopeptidase/acylaminoacyl peptidase